MDIKIEITAYGGPDDDNAFFRFTREVEHERPEAAVLRLAAMLIGASQHAPALRGEVDKSAAEAMAVALERDDEPC